MIRESLAQNYKERRFCKATRLERLQRGFKEERQVLEEALYKSHMSLM